MNDPFFNNNRKTIWVQFAVAALSSRDFGGLPILKIQEYARDCAEAADSMLHEYLVREGGVWSAKTATGVRVLGENQ